MNKDKKAVLLIILAGIMWGSLGVSVRLLSGFGFNAVQIVTIRFAGAAAIIGLINLAADRKRFRVEKRDIKILIALGLFIVLTQNIAYVYTTRITSLAVAGALLYTSPIFAMLVSLAVFKERITVKKVFAVLLNFFGCLLLSGIFSGNIQFQSPIGFLTGVLSGFCYGCYGIFARVLTEKYHPLTVTFYTFLLASIGGLCLSNPAQMAGIISADPISIVYILMASLICFVIPYGIYTYGVKFVEPSRAAVIVSTELVMAVVFGAVLFKEKITFTVFSGISCILLAIVILNLKLAKAKEAA